MPSNFAPAGGKVKACRGPCRGPHVLCGCGTEFFELFAFVRKKARMVDRFQIERRGPVGKRRWRARTPRPAGRRSRPVNAKRRGVRNASSALAVNQARSSNLKKFVSHPVLCFAGRCGRTSIFWQGRRAAPTRIPIPNRDGVPTPHDGRITENGVANGVRSDSPLSSCGRHGCEVVSEPFRFIHNAMLYRLLRIFLDKAMV